MFDEDVAVRCCSGRCVRDVHGEQLVPVVRDGAGLRNFIEKKIAAAGADSTGVVLIDAGMEPGGKALRPPCNARRRISAKATHDAVEVAQLWLRALA